jgi:hypothetical protein
MRYWPKIFLAVAVVAGIARLILVDGQWTMFAWNVFVIFLLLAFGSALLARHVGAR